MKSEIATPANLQSVLIVDDHKAARDLVRSILRYFPLEDIRERADGAAALDSHVRNPCDLIILDLKMPNMDGFSFIRLVRTVCSGKAARVPILVLSASLGENVILKADAAGASAFAEKPIKARDLCQTILDICRLRTDEGEREMQVLRQRQINERELLVSVSSDAQLGSMED